jgi:hypothetical protein
LTVIPGLVGLWHLYRRGQRGMLLLTGGAFGLGGLAAALGKYPYGSSYRIALHLAPFYCLLAGLGAAVLIHRLATARARKRAVLGVGAFLAVVGVGGMARDFLRPYRDESALWARRVTDGLLARAGDDPILALQQLEGLPPVLHWRLAKHRSRVVAPGALDWESHGREHSSVWVFVYGAADPAEQASIREGLSRADPAWRCVERTPCFLAPKKEDEPIETCRIYHWVRREQPPARPPRRVARIP